MSFWMIVECLADASDTVTRNQLKVEMECHACRDESIEQPPQAMSGSVVSKGAEIDQACLTSSSLPRSTRIPSLGSSSHWGAICTCLLPSHVRYNMGGHLCRRDGGLNKLCSTQGLQTQSHHPTRA